jgi:hypothetical protein
MLKTTQDFIYVWQALMTFCTLLSHENFGFKFHPCANTIGVIHIEYIDCRSTHRRETNNTTGLATYVMVPGVRAGMKQACKLTGFWVYTG